VKGKVEEGLCVCGVCVRACECGSVCVFKFFHVRVCVRVHLCVCE